MFLFTVALLSCAWSTAAYLPVSSKPLLLYRQYGHILSRVALQAETASETVTKRTAPTEVTQIFNDFAGHFEDQLINKLDYCTPLQVAQAASKRIQDNKQGRRYSTGLDAGCGTGLMGPHLRTLVSGPLVGVDLSPKMAELAAELVFNDENDYGKEEKNETAMPVLRRTTETARQALGNLDRVYDGIFLADLLDLSSARPLEGDYGFSVGESFPTTPYDLIASGDVLCYFGEMDTILASFSEQMAPGADLIFSTETLAEGDYNWVQTTTGRYAHNPEYVARMAALVGLEVVSQESFTPRMESGKKVLGTMHMFHKPPL